ncbi:MAG: transposase, partial [Acidobacteria bacterium]|nr:transposase [Acidobacteriota bacterium]
REKVHFIVRVRAKDLVYTPIRRISQWRRVGNLSLLLDAVVRLGGSQARIHPTVRLIVAILPSGEKLVLATDLLSWRAEDILAAYKKRGHIERFHRFLKDTLGLSHLYSFAQGGIAFLLYVALLLSQLLLLSGESLAGETIVLMRKPLRAVRALLGLGTPWRRNSSTVTRGRKKRNGKALKTVKR